MSIQTGEELEKATRAYSNKLSMRISHNYRKNWIPKFNKLTSTPNYLNPQRPSPRHIILKLPNINDRERVPMTVKTMVTKQTPLD